MEHAINWFEIPTADFERSCEFYSQILGTPLMQMEMEGQRLGMFPASQEGVSGAVVAGEGYQPGNTGTIVYLRAADGVDSVIARIEPAGGTILLPKTPVGEGMGYAAVFLDIEGNKVGLHSME